MNLNHGKATGVILGLLNGSNKGFRRVGCIDQRVEAKSLRCSLLRIPHQVLGKLQASGVTCSGVMTEVSEPICFVQCVGPTCCAKDK